MHPHFTKSCSFINGYILGPMAGQEASGSARPLYWFIEHSFLLGPPNLPLTYRGPTAIINYTTSVLYVYQ